MVSISRLLEVFSYNPETGIVIWKIRTSRRVRVGEEAGNMSKSLGYRFIQVDGEVLLTHRVVWAMMTGAWPSGGMQIDHIDRCRDNNKWENLRLVTAQQNKTNTGVRSHSASGVKGVHRERRGGKWRSQISINGKTVYLGWFDTVDEAAEAYNKATSARSWG